jgi:hypothetical protein
MRLPTTKRAKKAGYYAFSEATRQLALRLPQVSGDKPTDLPVLLPTKFELGIKHKDCQGAGPRYPGTETCIFVEPGHRRSIGARELRKFAAGRRKESDKRKPGAAPTAQKAPAVSQNGAGATAATKPVDNVEALLKTLAASNRPEPVAAGGLD